MGDDEIWGGDGDDVIVGGGGADYLIGGEGSDTFSYQGKSSGITLEGADTIVDFSADDDFIGVEILGYVSSDFTYRMADGSHFENFDEFINDANTAFSANIIVYVAFDVGFLTGAGLTAINHDRSASLSAGDSLIVLVGVTSDSSISGDNFITTVS